MSALMTRWCALAALSCIALGSTAARADEEKKEEKKEESDAVKDHDRVIRHFGASWFGISLVPIANAAPSGTKDNPSLKIDPAHTMDFLSVPAIGIRYWFKRAVGLDVGIGFSGSTGTIQTTTSAADKRTVFGFLAHAGLPLSVTSGKHISLQIIPEVNFGVAHSQVEPSETANPPPAADLWGTRFDIGARIGGEVFFGFIGLPELALEGSIGAYLTDQRVTASVGAASYAENNVLATTANFKDPWELFTSVIAARYYF